MIRHRYVLLLFLLYPFPPVPIFFFSPYSPCSPRFPCPPCSSRFRCSPCSSVPPVPHDSLVFPFPLFSCSPSSPCFPVPLDSMFPHFLSFPCLPWSPCFPFPLFPFLPVFPCSPRCLVILFPLFTLLPCSHFSLFFLFPLSSLFPLCLVICFFLSCHRIRNLENQVCVFLNFFSASACSSNSRTRQRTRAVPSFWRREASVTDRPKVSTLTKCSKNCWGTRKQAEKVTREKCQRQDWNTFKTV